MTRPYKKKEDKELRYVDKDPVRTLRRLTYKHIAVLCSIYILSRSQPGEITNRIITDYQLEKGILYELKSNYDNTRNRLAELENRDLLYSWTICCNGERWGGGPRKTYQLTPHGKNVVKEFYEKYRSPIEGPPLVDNTILKDNIGSSING